MLCWPCAVRRLSNTWVEGAHLTSAWVHFVRGTEWDRYCSVLSCRVTPILN